MTKSKIEFCDKAFSPVTGCLHNCPYCYAKTLCARFGGHTSPNGNTTDTPHDWDGASCITVDQPLDYMFKTGKLQPAPFPYGFAPTFHRTRLSDRRTAPAFDPVPSTVFVCPTADLFGEWVSDEIIADVMQACVDAPQHRYLFFTKNPARYLWLAKQNILPKLPNFWYGSSVTTDKVQWFWSKYDHFNAFVSIEPILGDFGSVGEWNFDGIDWVMIGAETGNRPGKFVPTAEIVRDITESVTRAGIPLWQKNSLAPYVDGKLIQQHPWEVTA